MTILLLGAAAKMKAQLEQQTKLTVVVATTDMTNEQLQQVTIVLGWEQQLGERLLHLTDSKLKWVQTYSAGVDDLPLDELRQKGVLVSNVSGIHAEPIAESVFGMLLFATRGFKLAVDQQAQHVWHRPSDTFDLVAGKQFLIYGTGHIGKRVAELAQQFKMQTIGVNHDGHAVNHFNQTTDDQGGRAYLKTADVILNIMPLTETTRNLFDASYFKQVKRQPIFINAGRGPSVVTADLITALQTGQLGFAALDVVNPEPLPKSSPLWLLPNVLLTPHISGVFPEYGQAVLQIFMKNLATFLKTGNLELNQVNLERGY
ncbi:NAD(P)-dependent oxidoreductase [Loigolactobacillus backii]|uniref:NAD(P)-dependent oxidoreductase n=1 Tax=Loigolactobacillus backii TaxID=375175 RepID=UPI001EE776A4|nr:NAD(P)-dependent oxidoreductase [Loigolactobacillus backii]MDA5388674.1 hydroxyacid dehydrogenase [Loigolactobacillus backii]MDA5391142.1 hydroxyacid dehydrogenase [Loigolactobacillus backii]